MSGAATCVEFRLLQSYCNELVAVLKKVEDLPKLLDQLCQFYIITKEIRSVLNTIDERVNLTLKVKYLVHHVCDQVCQDRALFGALLTIFRSSTDRKIVSLFNILSKKYESGETNSNEELAQVQVTDKLLTEEDIDYLMNDLARVAHKWKEISIALRVPKATLQDIKGEDSCKVKLYGILHVWITGGTPLKPATLTRLKEILKGPLVDLPEVADKVYCDDTSPAPKRLCSDSDQFFHPRVLYESLDTVVSYRKSTLLEVQVTSDKPTTYQWTKDGQLLSDDTSYQGTSSSILLVNHRNMASRHIEGRYVCEVEGIGRSREILVTIEYPESIQHLLDRYSSLREVPKDSWPPVRIKSFVELALINKKKEFGNLKEFDYSVRGDMDDILYKKENISYEKCFGKYESGTLLVVEGRPGVGKTTLAHKVTRDWSTGENVLVGADLVFLVSLRLLNVNKTNSIFNLLGFKCDKIDNESQKGLKCCFILDGLDEYKPYNYDETNFVYDLISNKLTTAAMVIVFSRPVGNKKLKKCRADVDKRIEILGFKHDQISHYINTYFQQNSQKAKTLKKYLEKHINVSHMCYLPVHVAMICYIHSQYEDSNILNTETQIYERFAMLTIIRKLRRECNNEVSNQPTCFQSLNDKDKHCFMQICKLAFDMCVNQRQVFESSNNEVILSDQSGSDKPSLGLVTVDSTAKLYNYHDIYAFLHLTFQEYLAAYHIFRQTSDQQLSIIDQQKDNDAMLVVLKFYCGMMGQDSQFLDHQVQIIFNSKLANTLYKIHCAFESQQSAVCDAAIDNTKQQKCLSFKKKIFTSGDYNAIGYVISEASGPIFKLAFFSCRLQENGVKQLIETTSNNRLQQVKTFVFHSPDPTLDQFQCVNSLLSRMKSLKVLDLYKTGLSHNAIIKLTNNVTLPHLKNLEIKLKVPFQSQDKYLQCLNALSVCLKPVTIHYHMVGRDCNMYWYHSVFESVFSDSVVQHHESPRSETVNFFSLGLEKNAFTNCSIFYFVNCTINDDNIKILLESLTKSNSVEKLVLDFNKICQGATALVSRCSKLKYLSIRCNSIDDEGAKSLAGAVHECTDLVYLDLEYNCFGDEGAIAIASAISHLKINLYLWNAKLTEKGVASVLSYVNSANMHCPQICDFKEVNTLNRDCFLRAIECCTSITSIKIYGNCLSNESAKLIKKLKSLEQLHVKTDYLNKINISLFVLFDSLKLLTNLQTLNISNNSINSEGSAALADGLKSCTNLQTLDISENHFGSEGAAALADGLKSCTNLRTLDISNNSIDSEGAAALADSLKSCTNLQTLDISENHFGSEGAAALADGLKSCTNLRTLDISFNRIDSEGAAALADSLKSCTNLQKLSIGWNHIGSEGTQALADSLKSCTNLQRLDISRNRIGSVGAAALADGLKSCTNLQTLNIMWNRIGSVGAAALADGHKSCTNFQILK